MRPAVPSSTRILTSIIFGTISAFALILVRLSYLQLHKSHDLLVQSEKNCTRIQNIPAPRGNILDREGRLLATNRPTTNLIWTGSGKKTFTEQNLIDIGHLEEILGKPLLSNEKFMEDLLNAERRYQKFSLATDLTDAELCKAHELFPTHENIAVVPHFKRLYPHNTMASHVLGYLGVLDSTHYGKMGLEKLYEEQLHGEFGSLAHMINSLGKNIATREIKKNQAGTDITTTLDIDLQTIMEEVFPAENNGAFILMNPENGALLGVLSRPNFDPALFLDPILMQDWSLLQEHKPFLNRAFAATYPPGSIFKLVTASAGLEQGLITQHTTCNCTGEITFAGDVRKCHNHYGHGRLDTCQALAQSCNIFFYEIGKHIDIDTLARYAHTFGLGEPTGAIFPEKLGLIPSRAWKKKTFGEKWYTGETLSAAIGQSYLLVSPIQIARMISSIFTGYLVAPRIVETDEIIRKPINLQHSTRLFLQQSMHAVVTVGTGQSASHVKDISLYAKTSTAQTSSLEKRTLGKRFLEHGWLVGQFSYKHHKPITIVIIIENIGSSSVATHTASRFLSAYRKLMDRRERESHEASKTASSASATSVSIAPLPALPAIAKPGTAKPSITAPAKAVPADAVPAGAVPVGAGKQQSEPAQTEHPAPTEPEAAAPSTEAVAAEPVAPATDQTTS